jgi:hypothetical protein
VARAGTAKPLRAGEWKIILARSRALELSHSLGHNQTSASEHQVWGIHERIAHHPAFFIGARMDLPEAA